MDIRCPTCLEPWDHDCLHEAVKDGLHDDYEKAAAAFRRKGCIAIGARCNPDRLQADDERPELVSNLYALLGDDMDGAASMLSDAEAMGLL